MKHKVLTFLILLTVSTILFSAFGCLQYDSHAIENENALYADDITSKCTISASGIGISAKHPSLTDRKLSTYAIFDGGCTLNISSEKAIGSLYIVFDKAPTEYTVSDDITGITHTAGIHGFVHEYADISDIFGSTEKLTFTFPTDATVSEIYVFAEGEPPPYVERWLPPCEKADLLLLPTHADDEQLFFAGILPYYTSVRKTAVQVVYLTNHYREKNRLHEQLTGLWTVGVRNYPVIGAFPDLYSENLASALSGFSSHGFEEEDFIRFQTEMICRFSPIVVVGHDINGEYGHGAHMLNTDTLIKALERCNSTENFYPDIEKSYGSWIPEKVYLHLYGEGKISMDFDTPFDELNGKTPFEVSQNGFRCHKSQHGSWFYGWIFGKAGVSITKASQIKKYSPCEYGLYFSSVGKDVAKNDFFENALTYAEREAEALEKDRLQKAEEERLMAISASEKAVKQKAISAITAATDAFSDILPEKREHTPTTYSDYLGINLLFGICLVLAFVSITVLLLGKRRRK